MAPLDPGLYTVAWIAPLEIEARAALLLLDNVHKGSFPMSPGDDYVYEAGDINGHNIVIASLPAGQEYGNSSAAAIAAQIKNTFRNLWFGLLVGVAAGFPKLDGEHSRDVRLGDVLVGLSDGESAGLVPFDLGKETNDGFQLLRQGSYLATTETVVRSAISLIKRRAPKEGEIFLKYYKKIMDEEHSNGTFQDPGQHKDQLYDYRQDSYSGPGRLVDRNVRPRDNRTRVWYGPIASGDKLMKNARIRDQLIDKYNVIGLEMEAAGTMNRINVGVIRGVCDYGDERKNKEWQPYAAAIAAAFAKALLYQILPRENIQRHRPQASQASHGVASFNMDPLIALGLASSVAQLLNLGSKIFKESREINSLESAVSLTNILQLFRDLTDINSILLNKCQPLESRYLTPEERALLEIAVDCKRDSGDILECLKAVNINSSSGQSNREKTWTDVKTALKTIWSEEKIEAMAKRMVEYRSQLSLRLLAVLNTHQAMQFQALGEVSRAKKEVVAALAVHSRDCKAASGSISAILTSRDEMPTAIIGQQADLATFHRKTPQFDAHASLSDVNVMQNNETSTLASTSFVRTDTDAGEADFFTQPAKDCRKLILDALHFRGMYQRHDSINRAHPNTFGWIWQSGGHGHWDDLSEWLRRGSGCYWIYGKAGSGKSSLTKFIVDDNRTVAALQSWSGSCQLVLGSFYFWYAGTTLQKSHSGLLRGLLFSALNARPSLAFLLFPDICRQLLSNALRGTLELSDLELKLAFARLIDSVPDNLRICFVVDGLDEYTGNLNELCDLFSQAARTTSIKIIVSSRPLPVCVDRFSSFPKLRLQDLTRGDIKQYTHDQLKSNKFLQDVERVEQDVTIRLINTITSRACGVFLWVVLVVRLLITRLQNHDSFSELQEEINKLPPDLEELYEKMLGSMSKEYRITSSKYLQLAVRSMGMSESYMMTPLQLSFAEDDDYNEAIRHTIKELTEKEVALRCKSVEGRLRSRCCGLLEVQELQDRSSSPYKAELKVPATIGFFHRTVLEFLQLHTVWVKLQKSTLKSTFDPELALLSSALAEFQAMPAPPPGQENHHIDDEITWRAVRVTIYERMFSEAGRTVFHHSYLPQFQRLLTKFCWRDTLFESWEEKANAVDRSVQQASIQSTLQYPTTFILYCALGNLGLRIEELERHCLVPQDSRLSPATILMLYITETDARVRSLASSSLSQLQFDPSFKYSYEGKAARVWNSRWKSDHVSSDTCSWTVWQFLLHYLFRVATPRSTNEVFDFNDPDMVMSMLDVISITLSRDPHLDETITVLYGPRKHLAAKSFKAYTATYILMQFLGKVWTLASSPSNRCFKELNTIASRAFWIEETIHTSIYFDRDKWAARSHSWPSGATEHSTSLMQRVKHSVLVFKGPREDVPSQSQSEMLLAWQSPWSAYAEQQNLPRVLRDSAGEE